MSDSLKMLIGLLLLMGMVASPAVGWKNISAGDPPKNERAGAMGGAGNDDTAAALAEEHVVAVVNGAELQYADLVKRTRQLAAQKYRHGQITPEISMELQKKALHQLIVEELAFQRAQALGITVEPEEVEDGLRQRQEKLKSDRHLQAFVEKKGPEDDPGSEIARYLMVRKAIAREVEDGIRVSDREVEQAYEQQKENFIQQEKVAVTDIAFFLDPARPESVRKAEEVRRDLLENLDGQPDRLAPDPVYAIMPEVLLTKEKQPFLYEAAKKLAPNEISAVINADSTLHVIKLTGYVPYVVKTLDEVRALLKRQLLAARKREAIEKWKSGLQENAKVEIDFDNTLPPK
jgi:hypothetical protein